MADPYRDLVNEWLNTPSMPSQGTGTLQPITRGNWGGRTPDEQLAASSYQFQNLLAPQQGAGFDASSGGLGGVGSYGAVLTPAGGGDLEARLERMRNTLSQVEEVIATASPEDKARYENSRQAYSLLLPMVNDPRQRNSSGVLQRAIQLDAKLQQQWKNLGEQVGTMPNTPSFGKREDSNAEKATAAEAATLEPTLAALERNMNLLQPMGQKRLEAFLTAHKKLKERVDQSHPEPVSQPQFQQAQIDLARKVNAVVWRDYMLQSPKTNYYGDVEGSDEKVWFDGSGTAVPEMRQPKELKKDLGDGFYQIWNGTKWELKDTRAESLKARASILERRDLLYAPLAIRALAKNKNVPLTEEQEQALNDQALNMAISEQDYITKRLQEAGTGKSLDPASMTQENLNAGQARATSTQDGLKKLGAAGDKMLGDIRQDGQMHADNLTKSLTEQSAAMARANAERTSRDAAVNAAQGDGGRTLAAHLNRWWLNADLTTMTKDAKVLPDTSKSDVWATLEPGMYRLGTSGAYILKLAAGPDATIYKLPARPGDQPPTPAGGRVSQRGPRRIQSGMDRIVQRYNALP